MRGVTVTSLAVSAVTASGEAAAVNVGEYHSIALLCLASGACDAGTNTVKLEHSDSGTGDWSDVPGGAFAPVGTEASEQVLKINADRLKKFVRVSDTLVTATSVVRSVSIVGHKQYS